MVQKLISPKFTWIFWFATNKFLPDMQIRSKNEQISSSHKQLERQGLEYSSVAGHFSIMYPEFDPQNQSN